MKNNIESMKNIAFLTLDDSLTLHFLHIASVITGEWKIFTKTYFSYACKKRAKYVVIYDTDLKKNSFFNYIHYQGVEKCIYFYCNNWIQINNGGRYKMLCKTCFNIYIFIVIHNNNLHIEINMKLLHIFSISISVFPFR